MKVNLFIKHNYIDYCEDAVQIACCYENFCDRHIKEELMKNFTCPNCKGASTMRDVVPNMKLRECIDWYKSLLKEGQLMHSGLRPLQHGLKFSTRN